MSPYGAHHLDPHNLRDLANLDLQRPEVPIITFFSNSGDPAVCQHVHAGHLPILMEQWPSGYYLPQSFCAHNLGLELPWWTT